jgi:excinuclease ABC subunit C
LSEELGRIDRLKALVKEFPTTPGVYLMKNHSDKVIYVGKAKDLKARVRNYLTKSGDQRLRVKYLVQQIENIEYMLTKTEVEAFLLEASLIKKFRPRYNIRLKDDKAYPYIKISMAHDFPRFYLARRVEADGGIYFGPYSSSGAVRGTMNFLNRTFKIRDCRDSFFRSRKRPCITYQMNQCTAPCVGYVNKEEYGLQVRQCIQFLKGKSQKVVKDLKKEMKKAAEEERFELAARLRDSVHSIEVIQERQAVVSQKTDVDIDVVAFVGDERGTLIETLHVRAGRVIGTKPHFLPNLNVKDESEEVLEWMSSFLNQFYLDNKVPDEIVLQEALTGDMIRLLQAVLKERQGVTPSISVPIGEEGKRLLDMALANAKSHFEDQVSKRDMMLEGLQMIQRKLQLPELPKRIECYDISHFQGQDNVASQVVFEEGVPKKDDYRKYKLNSFEGANDFLAMKEVLSRRLRHTEYDDPQLIVVDGGKGQLSLAREALKEIGRPEIPLVALAKARVKGTFSDQEVVGSEERFFLPGRQNPVVFARNSVAFQILTGIRDEAHRFAITFHRKLREERSLSSALDEINGLGEVKKKALLKKFGSVEAISQANADELCEIKGITPVLAQRILLHLS